MHTVASAAAPRWEWENCRPSAPPLLPILHPCPSLPEKKDLLSPGRDLWLCGMRFCNRYIYHAGSSMYMHYLSVHSLQWICIPAGLEYFYFIYFFYWHCLCVCLSLWPKNLGPRALPRCVFSHIPRGPRLHLSSHRAHTPQIKTLIPTWRGTFSLHGEFKGGHPQIPRRPGPKADVSARAEN